MTPPRILLTGFEPFDGASTNPSWLLAQAMHGQQINGARVQAVELPCVFGLAQQTLQTALQAYKPRWVLALGLAAGRAEMSVERVAINVDDARIPDNQGQCPIDCPVVLGGPGAYFSTLPIKTMVQRMQAAGVPAAVSQTAGTFVCNHVFYALMHMLRRRKGVAAGFMHVPQLSGSAAWDGMPSLDWETQLRGIEVALLAATQHVNDAAISGGAIC